MRQVGFALGVPCLLVESGADLPSLGGERRLYMDFETTSGEDSTPALSPYGEGQRVAGAAVLLGDRAIYAPVKHRGEWNDDKCVPEDIFRTWLRDALVTDGAWVNANVKFDANFAAGSDAIITTRELHCLIVKAKLVDSDMLSYDLTRLSRAFAGVDISSDSRCISAWLKGFKTKTRRGAQDYGLIPVDMMCKYACQDVIAARLIDEALDKLLPAESEHLWEIERRLTSVLFDIERRGLRVDVQQLEIAEYRLTTELIRCEEDIAKTAGRTINPASSSDCYDLLHLQFGLPVLQTTDKGNPSFDNDSLRALSRLDEVLTDERRARLIKLLLKHAETRTTLNLFVKQFLAHQRDGRVHPDYNQCLHTGRMSCKEPNQQNLNNEAKKFILPDDGHVFLSGDWSQIEFRLIAHYIQAHDVIASYAKDPWTDFHQWVADQCGADRDVAKNVNFCIGFAGGKGAVHNTLLASEKFLDLVRTEVLNLQASGDKTPYSELFNARARARAEATYEAYHAALPTLRETIRRAMRTCQERGYVRNLMGRRRSLPRDVAYKAFNNLCQSSAADIMKEAMTRLSPRWDDTTRHLGAVMAGSVHDEILMQVPNDRAVIRELTNHAAKIMENPSAQIKVPMRVSFALCAKNWSDKSKISDKDIDRS